MAEIVNQMRTMQRIEDIEVLYTGAFSDLVDNTVRQFPGAINIYNVYALENILDVIIPNASVPWLVQPIEPLLKRRGPGRPMKLELRAVVDDYTHTLGFMLAPNDTYIVTCQGTENYAFGM